MSFTDLKLIQASKNGAFPDFFWLYETNLKSYIQLSLAKHFKTG